MSSPQLPDLTADTRDYWTRGERGELAICHCNACDFYIHPPSPVCPRCSNFEVRPVVVSGAGSVATYTINYQPWSEGQVVPFVFATIELDEQAGLFLLTNIVGCAVNEVFIGMRVQVQFEQHEDIWLPQFSPQGAA